MRVIAFTGLPGSGKSVAVDAVRRRGIPVVRMGDFVLDEVRRRGLPVEEAHIGPVATGMREAHGPDVWARKTVEAIRDHEVQGVDPDTRLIAIDGVRSLAEIEHFRNALGTDFHLIAIDAPAERRHGWIVERGRADDEGADEWAAARDERERGWGVDEAIARADHHIVNDADVDTLRGRVETLLDALVA